MSGAQQEPAAGLARLRAAVRATRPAPPPPGRRSAAAMRALFAAELSRAGA